jgi:hypothetical protein
MMMLSCRRFLAHTVALSLQPRRCVAIIVTAPIAGRHPRGAAPTLAATSTCVKLAMSSPVRRSKGRRRGENY